FGFWQSSKPVIVTGAQHRQGLRRSSIILCEFFKPRLRELKVIGARGKLGFLLALALVRGVASKAEPTDNAWQQQALADKRDDDDAKCNKQNEIATREWRAGTGGQRYRQCCRKRDHPAHAYKREKEEPLPRWQRVSACNCCAEPAR